MDPRALLNPENMYLFLYYQYYLLIFLNSFLTYDSLPFRQLSELEFQLLSDFAKVKVWATEKVRSGSSKKLIKTQYYSLFDPFQLHITLV